MSRSGSGARAGSGGAPTWRCGSCTLDNALSEDKSSVCGSAQSDAIPSTDPSTSEPESRRSALAEEVEALRTRVAELSSELDVARAEAMAKEDQVAQMRGVLYDMRELLFREREDRRAVVDKQWFAMSLVLDNLDRAKQMIRSLGRSDTDVRSHFTSLSEEEATTLEGLTQKAKAHKAVTRWREMVLERQSRTKNFILSHADNWIQKARLSARRKLEERATEDATRLYLLEQKHMGIRLSLSQENFLKLPAVEDGQTWECPVCFDEFGIDSVLILEDCKHHLCASCMRMYISTVIRDGQPKFLVCPEADCKRILSSADVNLSLDPESPELARYLELMLQEHLADDPHMVRCPKPRCQTPMIKETSTPMVVCPNPGCKFSFCANCKVEWHADSTCEQYQALVKENAAADDLYARWIEKNTKPCPKSEGGCGALIENCGGSNDMVCPRCRFPFCSLCGKKYTSGHFSSSASGPCAGKQFS